MLDLIQSLFNGLEALRKMGLRSATRAFLGRWYVSTVLLTALGIAAGYLVFFNVYPGRPQIGVIDISFTIIGEDSAFVIGEMLDHARRNDSIKAVVIKLISPGGDAAASEQLQLKTLLLREEKPVVVATGWINASGGMLWSVAANYHFVQPSSIVGSIGVFLGLGQPPPPDEFLITSGPAKLTGGSERSFTALVELVKESFVKTVVAQRGERLRMTEAELSKARIYVGMEAVRLGLVDALGSDADAVEKAAALAGISNYELVDLNEWVFRHFVLKERRIFGVSDEEDTQSRVPDIGRLRRIASSSLEEDGQPAALADLPFDLKLPRMYYLYVTPTE